MERTANPILPSHSYQLTAIAQIPMRSGSPSIPITRAGRFLLPQSRLSSPAGLGGASVLVQGFVLSPAARNGFFVASDGVEIQL